jgi:ferritin-like metal-binding protein YciE
MRKAALSEELSEAFMLHTGQREEHVERLKSVFERLHTKQIGKRCAGVKGIVAEAEALLAEEPKADPSVLEAASIGAAQRAEHYEIARFVSREKGLAKRGVCESYRVSHLRLCPQPFSKLSPSQVPSNGGSMRSWNK